VLTPKTPSLRALNRDRIVTVETRRKRDAFARSPF
jgi:hypothetical protein